MRQITSPEFRKSYPRLQEPVEVTALGRVIGTYVPGDNVVDGIGLSAEQTNILHGHLASRQQTAAEFFGDVLMSWGLGRTTGKEYPPAMTADRSAQQERDAILAKINKKP